MTDSDPRALATPTCPSCRTAYSSEIRMRAVAGPAGAEPGRYFVCDRCNFTLKDRRRGSRPPLTEGPPLRW